MDSPYYGLPPVQLATPTPSRELLVSVRDSLVEQRRALELQILSTNALLNAMVPIMRLPNELIVQILLDLKRCQPAGAPWYAVGGVCRAWRAVVTSTPLLWANIRIGRRANVTLFQVSLERSHPMPIAVTFSYKSSPPPYLSHLAAHLPRIRSLQFDHGISRGVCREVIRLLETGLPVLEQLSVRLDVESAAHGRRYRLDSDDDDLYSRVDEGDSRRDVVWSPSRRRFPRLTELSLERVVLGPASTMSPSLRRLELSDCFSKEASLETLLDLLRDCRHLEELSIRDHSRATPTRSQAALLPITLPPVLRKLHLDGYDWYIANLLQYLSVPPTTEVYIVSAMAKTDEDTHRLSPEPSASAYMYQCIPDDKACLPLLTLVDRVQVEWHDSDALYTIVGSSGSGPTITFSPEYPTPPYRFAGVPNVARDLAEIFGDAPVVEITVVDLGMQDITTADWRRMLGRFPLLEKLVMIDGTQSVSAQLNLGRPCRSYNDYDPPTQTLVQALKARRSLLCPYLRELAISSQDVRRDGVLWQEIEECLESRQAHGHRLAKLQIGLAPLRVRSTISHAVYGVAPRSREAPQRRKARCRDALGHLVDTLECDGDDKFFTDRWLETDEEDEILAIEIMPASDMRRLAHRSNLLGGIY